MKIENLAIIFVIIILPISIVLSAYTQFQIKTLNLQTLYDTKLTSATYDAIKAFQVNTSNSTMSDLSNSKLRDIEASVSTFKTSIMSTFGLNGYTEEDLNSYIPALVYTMYDGFYIYSPYTNVNYMYEYQKNASGAVKQDSNGEPIKDTSKPMYGNGENEYGLKPYITYSCRYVKGGIDVVITYSLDNYITIQGTINNGKEYVNREGYLIDNITNANEDNVTYNGVTITKETELKEYVLGNEYPYIKVNGTKYYYDTDSAEHKIFYISNGKITVQGDLKGTNADKYYTDKISSNDQAIQYYKQAKEFTEYVENTFGDLTYGDARTADGRNKIWSENDVNYRTKIFTKYDSTKQNNIEKELSNFNQHRLAVIRHVIEENLSIAISNYNKYSQATGIEFQMPELKEDEWDRLINNISLISFVQGLDIGGKVYNGYTIVSNSESKEVVLEENIYILGNDKYYYRIGDNTIANGTVGIAGQSAGRLNLDFKRTSVSDSTGAIIRYYYPLKNYDASYNSIVTQNDVTTFDDIYDYIEKLNNNDYKIAFYTALGRERQSAYKALRTN